MHDMFWGKYIYILYTRGFWEGKKMDIGGLGQGKKWDMIGFGEEAHPNFINAHDSFWGLNFSHNGYLYIYLNPFDVNDWKNVGYKKRLSLSYSQLKFRVLFIIHLGNLKLVNNWT